MEMENHMSEKEDSCYDNAEAAFSDDEDDLNSKGEECRRLGTSAPRRCRPALRAAAVHLLPAPSLRDGGSAVSAVPFPPAARPFFLSSRFSSEGEAGALLPPRPPQPDLAALCPEEEAVAWLFP